MFRFALHRANFGLRSFVFSGLSFLWLALLLSCSVPPTPSPVGATGASNRTTLLDVPYPLPLPQGRALDARQAWRSGGTAAKAIPVQAPFGTGWQFCCAFGQKKERAFWDLPLNVDMRAGSALLFRFRSRDVSAASRFFFYFKSGNGWYGTSFAPSGTGEWETVVLWKHDTFIEGAPAGWSHIGGVRVAVSPAAGRDMAFELAGLQLISGDPGAVIMRNTGAPVRAGSSEARSLVDFPARVGHALARAGIWPMLVEDQDLKGQFLSQVKARTVLLPYHMSLPPTADAELRRHLARGGRLGGFFKPPAFAAAALEFRTGSYVNATAVPDGFAGIALRSGGLNGAPAFMGQASWMIQDQRPLSSRCQVVGTWKNGRGGDTGYPAILLHPKGFWMSHVYLDNDQEAGTRLLLALVARDDVRLWEAAARDAMVRLPAGDTLRRQAEQAFTKRDFVGALRLAGQGQQALRQQRLASIPSASGERRGAWCHRAYGIVGMSWMESVRLLRRSGFDTLYANLAWPAAAGYPSRVIPADPALKGRGDLLAEAAAACKANEVELHVWIACLNLGEHATPGQVAAFRQAGRLQVNAKGAVNPQWLCPTHPVNRKLLVDACRELAGRDGVAGVHLDFIRFPDDQHCFCPRCRQAFEQMIGQRVSSWPTGGVRHPRWREFRSRQISSLVQEIHAAVNQENRAVKLSAAVFDHPQNAATSLGQDWSSWCHQGWVDWLCPMNYTANPRHFSDMVQRQMAVVQGTSARLYPGIGVRSLRLTPLQTAEQIVVTRQQKTGGFTLFEFNADEARGVFPELGRTVTKPR